MYTLNIKGEECCPFQKHAFFLYLMLDDRKCRCGCISFVEVGRRIINYHGGIIMSWVVTKINYSWSIKPKVDLLISKSYV